MKSESAPTLDLANRVALGLREAAQALGVSERHLRDHLSQIPHFSLGHRTLIPVDAVRRWAAERAREQTRDTERDAGSMLEALGD